MNVIIAGTRNFNNYPLLKEQVDKILKEYSDDNIVVYSGCATGADFLGERYAQEKGFTIQYFPAQWGTYGKAAGPLRNAKMADHADLAICFWDGKSRGTHNMIQQMKERNKPVKIIIYN